MKTATKHTIYTVGHSTHEVDHFIGLLKMHGITAIADVRSSPYSRMNPQYNRENLQRSLAEHNIQYVFLGKELGARSDDPACYQDGKVQYVKLAETDQFKSGIERLSLGSKTLTISLMCAEKEPLECHRSILVARQLHKAGFDIGHIHADGTLENHSDAVLRLLKDLKLGNGDLFMSEEEIIAKAYEKQENRIAYVAEPVEIGGELP
jgi:uncharacterized protein (DUF488 family)